MASPEAWAVRLPRRSSMRQQVSPAFHRKHNRFGLTQIQVLAKRFYPPSVHCRGDDEPRDCVEVDVTGPLR